SGQCRRSLTALINGEPGLCRAAPVSAEAQAEYFTAEELADGTGWYKDDGIDNATLWQLLRAGRERLVQEARARTRKAWLQRGASPAELGWVDSALDPDVLTIGFARRVRSEEHTLNSSHVSISYAVF